MENEVLKNRMIRPNDYHRLIEVRAAESTSDAKMILEGRAVVFDEETVLFKWDDIEYKEIIKKGSFNETDFSNAFLKYNHSDVVMPMARYKNGTLKIDVRDDGVWVNAELADTSASKDLYALVKRGDIDKMSFAFTIREESYDQVTHTWTVLKVDRLYDVAAVNIAAYESTELYARRYGDVEARRKEVEASLQKQQIEQKKQIAQAWINAAK
ncbi:MAG: hypothetical protein A2Y16_05415 [Tenericutes bacterium GWF2_57_13]|nr:MAG: hypothetical protein A2Y16_05415 [Tenericutes bacterium GWF2_57_13]